METERNDRLSHMSGAFRAGIAPPTTQPAISSPMTMSPGFDVRSVSDSRRPPMNRVWDGLISRGKLTLLTGESATGKTFLMLELAAVLACGERGRQDSPCDRPGDVLFVAGEDDLDETLCPRLAAAGADLGRIHFMTGGRRTDHASSRPERSAAAADLSGEASLSTEPGQSFATRFQLDEDLSLIEAKLQQLRQQDIPVPLIVIDSLRYCTGLGNRRRQATAEETVAELASLAKRWQLAVVVVSADSPAANRRLKPWNTALAETARTVWMVTRDPEDPLRRLLLPVRSYLAATPPGWAFAIRDIGLEWEPEPLEFSAAEYAARVKVTPRNRTRALIAERESAWALKWLAQQLDAGPVCIDTLRRDARDCNVTAPMLRQAFFQLNCQVDKEPALNSWCWHLPLQPFSRASHDGFSRASHDGLPVEARVRVDEDGEGTLCEQNASVVQDVSSDCCDRRADVDPPGPDSTSRTNRASASGLVSVTLANLPRRRFLSATHEPADEQEGDEDLDEKTEGALMVMEMSGCPTSGLTPERRALLRNQRKARRKNRRRHR